MVHIIWSILYDSYSMKDFVIFNLTQRHVFPSPSGGCKVFSILFSRLSEVISEVSSLQFCSFASFDNFRRIISVSSFLVLSIFSLINPRVRYFETSQMLSLLNYYHHILFLRSKTHLIFLA